MCALISINDFNFITMPRVGFHYSDEISAQFACNKQEQYGSSNKG